MYQINQDCFTEEKRILFSGTPCQVTALHSVISYHECLITVPVIYEETPLPKPFNAWIKLLEDKYRSKIVSMKFKKKERYVWKSPSSEYIFDNGKWLEQLAYHVEGYIHNFICGLIMRNSCFCCKYKGNNITADIIIGNCWCADPSKV